MHKTVLAGVTGTHQLLSTSQPTGVNSYSLKYAATSTASGQIGSRQIIERFADYTSKEVTYSRWVKSNSTDARVIIDDGVTVTAGTAHTGGGAWELLTVTATINASPTELTCYAVIASDALANVSITSGDYIEFTDVRLDLGSHRLSGDREYGEELALCKRYYQKSYDYNVATGSVGSNGSSMELSTRNGNNFTPGRVFEVEMRAAPSVVIYSTVTGASGNIDNGGDKAASAIGIGTKAIRYVSISSGAAASHANWHYTASAEL